MSYTNLMNSQLQGFGLLIATTAMYGLYGIYARLIALEFGVFSQNWVRNTFVLLLAIFFAILLRQKWTKIDKRDAPWILGWVLCDVIFVISIFISFNTLTIGTALFLLYCGSTIAGYAAGSFLLKERLTKIKIAAIVLSFSGLLFIFMEQIQLVNLTYLSLGLFTGVVAGLWNVFPKLISTKYPKLEIIALDALGILLVNILFAQFFSQSVPTFSLSIAWLGILLYGATQFLADIMLIRGFRLVEAHIGSLILPLEAVFGLLFAFIFFRETLPLATIFGGFLILFAAFLPNLKFSRK